MDVPGQDPDQDRDQDEGRAVQVVMFQVRAPNKTMVRCGLVKPRAADRRPEGGAGVGGGGGPETEGRQEDCSRFDSTMFQKITR